MAELRLEEAMQLYKTSEEAKEILLTKFSKDELEGKKIPTQEEFNKFFADNIFPLIDDSKTKFLNRNTVSKIPTSRIVLNNSNDEWLFDYNYDQENSHFWYHYSRVCNIFMKKFSLQDVDRHRLMKSLVEKQFNLYDCQPVQDI